jgi:hypothetical protein
VKEDIYIIWDVTLEQGSPHMWMGRNDRGAWRQYKQFQKDVPEDQRGEFILKKVGSFDRDKLEGAFHTPIIVRDPALPLQPDELEEDN